MRMPRKRLVLPLILLTAFSSNLSAAQRHAVDPSALANAVVAHAAEQQADRAAIREALARPEVQETAEKAGIDLNRLSSWADTLTGDDLTRAADAARAVNNALVGGASVVVISTTTIVIVLLIVLIVVLAT